MAERAEQQSTEPLPWWIHICRIGWKIVRYFWATFLVTLVLPKVVDVLFSEKTLQSLPNLWPILQMIIDHPIWTLLTFLGLLLLTGLFWFGSRQRIPTAQRTLTEQNRARMLERLRRTYADLMRQSLQGAMWMDLGLSEKPGAVRNAATLLLRTGNQPERPLPADTQILAVYDQTAHELLILGAPGAGKSTLLLDLAQQLVKRATQEADHPLPVILPLSSWAVKRPALQEWVVEQLAQIYDIPRLVGERWVREHAVLPLLDGLDEMDEVARPACIVAINAYHQAHLGIPLVVCSRLADYEAAAERQRLVLQNAVVVQPLEREQVDTYLQDIGLPVAALRRAITKNAALQELATTPLMLNVLMLTYQGITVRALPKKEGALRQQVWTDYVARMVQHKGDPARYPLELTRDWLSWLARQMRAHQRSIFYEEYVWTDWLESNQQRRTATWLSLRLPALVLGSIIFLFTFTFIEFIAIDELTLLLQIALLGGFVGLCLSRERNAGTAGSGLQTPPSKRALLMRSIALGVLVAATPGLSFRSTYFLGDWIQDGGILGLGIALSAWVFQTLVFRFPRQQPAVAPHYPSSQGRISAWFNTIAPRHIWQAAIVLGAGVGLSDGLSDVLSVALKYGLSAGLSDGLGVALSNGLIFGVSAVLLSTLLGALSGTLRFAEQIHWTWQSLRRPGHLSTSLIVGGILFLLIGLSYGLSVGLSDGLEYGLVAGLSVGLSVGLSAGLSYWVLLGFYQGIQQEQVKDQDRHQFNQGIRRSLRNGILIGLVGAMTITGMGLLNAILFAGLDAGLDAGLGAGLSYGLSAGLSNGLSYGLSVVGLGVRLSTWWLLAISGFLLMWAMSGGLTILRHYVIRWLLARSRTFPWRAHAFLDDATARILLQRVGGGYRFMHRLLLDYFADLDQTGAPADPAAPSVASTALTPLDDPSA